MTGHWSRVCRTPSHFVKLYRDGKGKAAETNYIENENIGNFKRPNMNTPTFFNQDGGTSSSLNFDDDLI